MYKVWNHVCKSNLLKTAYSIAMLHVLGVFKVKWRKWKSWQIGPWTQTIHEQW